MATAITYRTGDSASKLRTVIVDEVKRTVVLASSERLELVQAKLLHGTACRHFEWAEWLDLDPDDDSFAVAADQVHAIRHMPVAVKVSVRK
jgi:hypothetical protein